MADMNCNTSVKLEPFGTYNIDRNYQQIDDANWDINGLTFYEYNGKYYIYIKDIKVIYKDIYTYDKRAYSFIGGDITLELADLNFKIANNLIYLYVKGKDLFLSYNVTDITNDNFILLGVLKNQKMEIL